VRLLLDTHTFLWWDADAEPLSRTARTLLENPSHELLLSVVSVWELYIKTQLGKLEPRAPIDEIVAEQIRSNHLVILPVYLEHVAALNTLPLHHRDPFDRLLIAQATTEGATLVSKDEVFKRYPVALIW